MRIIRKGLVNALEYMVESGTIRSETFVLDGKAIVNLVFLMLSIFFAPSWMTLL